MSVDVRDFEWFVLDGDDEIVALFQTEKAANIYVAAMAEEDDNLRATQGYFNFDSSCTVSV